MAPPYTPNSAIPAAWKFPVALADSLEMVAADVRSCPRCRLSETRTVAVPGEGPSDARLFFIGEGPGFNEDQQGRPFVGAAGHLLVEMLRGIGLTREEVFITNVVRCRPPGNRDPRPDELTACDVYTVRQIAQLRPGLIVTLGRYSMARFFGPNSTVGRTHGTTTLWNGTTCLAMYHPAYILRDRSPALRKVYEEDFQKIPPLLARVEGAAGPLVKTAEIAASVIDPPLNQLKLL